MGKYGICACYDTKNYGSMLQALAIQVVINELGYDNEFIVYKKKKTPIFLLKQLPRLLNRNLMADKLLVIRKNRDIKKYPEIQKQLTIRNQAFKRFQDTYYTDFSDTYYGYDALKKGASKYSSIVVGSDQLWTPGGLATNFYNLMFAPDNVNKVSYATSFGVSNIPWYQINRTKKYLKRINYLSVREINGAKIVKEISGRTAEVVADPTILLGKKEWDTQVPIRKLVPQKYIFCYFLGNNEEHREAALKLSKEKSIQIISTPFLDEFVKTDLSFGDKQLFNIGPDDFINLIRNAEYVLTDSFHCTVFSLLYHKNFVVLDRFSSGSKNSRNSRIDSLCLLTETSQKRYSGDILGNIEASIDYSVVDKNIETLRHNSMDFLSNALAKKG